MEFFKQNTKIQFLQIRKYTAAFSIVLFVFSILSLCVYGLNFGLDFTGGTQVEVSFQHSANLPQIRQQLAKAGLDQVTVQSYGGTKDVLISLGTQKGSDAENEKLLRNELTKQVMAALPKATFKSVSFIGSKVSSELAYKGILAAIVAMIGIMIYVALRFEYRLAISAAVAMIHDPVLILGIFSFFKVQFDLTAFAAVLAVVGYSLNDTIVVFDRVRENFRRMRKGTAVEVVNASINQTLSRTVMTSGLTMIVVVVLYLFGGATIHSFSLALIIGILVGTYSSIYVAGAFAVFLGLSKNDLMPAVKKELDERP
jgi:preprotein translocase subunit SecF